MMNGLPPPTSPPLACRRRRLEPKGAAVAQLRARKAGISVTETGEKINRRADGPAPARRRAACAAHSFPQLSRQ
eukprot:9476132-Pyramimonas_sp.AAC.1